MKQLLLQAFNLIRQNPFYATISIIGTAVTIAFVMVVVMIYDFRTMDMAPESDRSDMMYTGSGMTYRKLDHTNQNSGMGRKAFEALFSELPSVKEVTWYRGVSKTPCNLSASNEIFNYYVRPVADNWFKFFDYEFIAGRSFTQEEYDARRWVSVITERMALQLFGTTDVVGKEYSEAAGIIAGQNLGYTKRDGANEDFIVAAQYPAAGTKVKRGSSVYVYDQ